VEYFRLLATSTHVNHVRADRPATVSVRDADALDLVPPRVALAALDPLAHTAEVRRIAAGRGRYGIPNVGVFLFPAQVYEVDRAPARAAAPGSAGWSVHPLGHPTPLFAVPTTEEAIERLARESDLPVPLRPRRLLGLLRDARAAEAAGTGPAALPVEVRIGGEALPLAAERLRVCGLEDLAESAPGTALDGWQVSIDAVAGPLRLRRHGRRRGGQLRPLRGARRRAGRRPVPRRPGPRRSRGGGPGGGAGR
jgi:hypothetical protein